MIQVHVVIDYKKCIKFPNLCWTEIHVCKNILISFSMSGIKKMIESSENKIEHDFLCYIVILPLHETSTYVGVVIIRYNNFAAVVYDGSYLFIEIRFTFTLKSKIKRKFLNVMICKMIL